MQLAMLRPAGFYGPTGLLRAFFWRQGHTGFRGLPRVPGAAGGFLGRSDAPKGGGMTVFRHDGRQYIGKKRA